MRSRNLRDASLIGLAIGVVIVFLGYIQECTVVCPPPSSCSCVPPLALPLLIAGLAIIVLSGGGMAWSYRK